MSAKDEVKKKITKRNNLTEKQKNKEKLKIMSYFNKTFASEEGIKTLRYLKNTCGFDKISIVGNAVTGDINYRSTLYNEARRAVYLELRQFIKTEILKQVEFE
jgi:hypothetical protein